MLLNVMYKNLSTRAPTTVLRVLSSATLPSPPLGSFPVRVSEYGHETFALETLSSIRPNRSGGWSVECYDKDVKKDVRKALMMAAHRRGLQIYDDGPDALRVEVADANSHHTSWKQERRVQAKNMYSVYQENAFVEASDSSMDALTPRASSLQARLAKTWAPVNTKQAVVAARRARAQARRHALETQAAAAVDELNLSSGMVARFERIASSNKKAMRQLLKRATRAAFDETAKPVWT